MSIQLIQQYHTEIGRKKRYGGSKKESALRNEFYNLIQQYARPRKLEFIAELDYRLPGNRFVTPDGTLKDALRQDWGYWESKDADDDLDKEIANKTAKGYPTTNILYEDSETAILIQAGTEVARVKMLDAPALDALLTRFVSYESQEVRAFHEAIDRFREDVPGLAELLRQIIRDEYEKNLAFRDATHHFLALCQKAINPSVESADVREMIIQHILTQDIFNTIFDELLFHQENAIAKELGRVTATFYKGTNRRHIDAQLSGYYQTIKARAAAISDHNEKQKFLKILYETFYKAYNPKGADRLGIVYTPNEIVRFMIEGADYLCFKHFNRTLAHPNVHILDPATGTGTFITELLDYLPPHQLTHKYKHELHCNEVAILPYYIASLNIEYTYQQITGQYEPFENILFVDTLDNMGFTYENKQLGIFGLADENAARIKAQNEREISVIIGNPPYNANQLNENDNNKNREYPTIDKRIKDTYIKYSTAQKTKLYDMYSRFYRWASDRLKENGIVAFITNRSFLEARTFDGFRKVMADEFSHLYFIDLGGDVRKNPKLSGSKHNVFAIQTGVAIAFLVRRREDAGQPCQIYYARRPEMEEAHEKLRFLSTHLLRDIQFNLIRPSKNNWLNLADKNDWDNLIPVADKDFKLGKGGAKGAIFQLFSLGIATNRDEWVYDFDQSNLCKKIEFFCQLYQSQVVKWSKSDQTVPINDFVDRTIKWTSELEHHMRQKTQLTFEKQNCTVGLYRPFIKKHLYYKKVIVHRTYQNFVFFPHGSAENLIIAFSGSGSSKLFQCLVTNTVPGLDLLEKTQCLPLYRYDKLGNRHDNITDWALKQFQAHYVSVGATHGSPLQQPSPDRLIQKKDIFHYVYAVLHHPAYRTQYELNLKRDFPRIPFYDDFWQWAEWGKQLMALHLDYETVAPYPLARHEADPDSLRIAYKAMLKADKSADTIQLDTLTTLSGIPSSAWAYKLGNRSALEWILDRYKESKPKDPTIREKFDTYRFADYKEQVIDLLMRVTTVSVETMAILKAMPTEIER